YPFLRRRMIALRVPAFPGCQPVISKSPIQYGGEVTTQ
ncbi:unnamed protein product, partial [marine sediment metagenome]